MKWLTRLFKLFLSLTLLGMLTGAVALLGIYMTLAPDLPSTENLRDIQLQVPLRIYTREGDLIAEFGEKRRSPISYADLPEKMVQAFLAAEDDRFFKHPGVDYQGILRAGVKLILTGERRQGGSTITMQVARNVYLSPEKTYKRKLSEILLALQIERELTKEEILELYLNKIYLGNRAYGVGAAAEVYYGKTLGELDLAQIAMIAGLPKAPSTMNPIANPERAVQRRNYVLGRMLELEFITPEEHEAAIQTPVTAEVHSTVIDVEAPYAAEMVRSVMFEQYGGSDAYSEGYRVITTLETNRQRAATEGVRKALHEYDQRHGYRGPEHHFDLAAHTTEEAWDSLLKDLKTVGDLRPALVIEVAKDAVVTYLGSGQRQRIEWEGLEWARPYIDENRRGEAPKQAKDILKVGDAVRLLQVPIERKKGEKELIWRLGQIPQVEGALVSLLPDDGAIAALVGGFDYYHSKFNRVIQAKRQPGSGFKAFIYSAALEAGFTAASIINDAPVVINDSSLEAAWRPENYSGKFYGPTRLRYALTHSRNLVSIRLLRAIGVDFALRYAERFGFDAKELPRNLSLALGSGAIAPIQMAKGYAVLANGGYLIEPYFIDRIENSAGEVIFQANPARVCETCGLTAPPVVLDTPDADQPGEGVRIKAAVESNITAAIELKPSGDDAPGQEATPRIAPRVITPQNHYLMNSMMRDVIQHGTATKARSLGRQDLAGKTGTTNEQRDAWFNGFNRSLVAIAWVGFDSSAPLGKGEVGGKAALPAWIAYMEKALQGVEEKPLTMPEDMVSVRIDPKTGKLAEFEQQDAIFEVFRSDHVPQEVTSNVPIPTQPGEELPEGERPAAGDGDLF